jgi:hypothetical protein
MATKYAEDIEETLQSIREEGTVCIWHYAGAAEAEPGTAPSWEDEAPTAPTPYPDTPILLLPINRVDFESIRDVKGTEIPQGRYQGLLPGGVPFSPTLKDICELENGRRFSVVNYDRIDPDGTAILYIMQLQEE